MKKLNELPSSTVCEIVEPGNKDFYEYKLTDPSKYNTEDLTSIIDCYLKKINKEDISPFVGICMGEIVSNSIKANLKRVHFILNNLDINNPKEYELGMQNFHNEGLCMLNDKETVKKIRKMDYYVKVDFYLSDNCFFIVTINNCAITPEEQQRIYAKMKMAEESQGENLFTDVVDTTEGSGLGILMIQRLLNQMGLSSDCFSITARENETVTELCIPV
ncbi:MAG: hypothetical protein K5681_05125 [Treponema sp.]|nr:hypothetical protein [Treponema sp.]